MQNKILRKGMVVGIIVLFIGVGNGSAINSNVKSANMINKIENLNPDTKTFYPTGDAFVTEAVGHGNNNYGNELEIHVSNKYGATPDWERNIFIIFDISSLPPHIKIISAKLYLYYYYYMDTNPVGRPLTVHCVLDDWYEDTITYNTQPPVTTEVSSTANVPYSTNTWISWDLTSDVKDFVKGQKNNHGWKIMDETYWGWYNLPVPYFRSKEYGSESPYLEIEFTKSKNKDTTHQLSLQFLERYPLLNRLLNLVN